MGVLGEAKVLFSSKALNLKPRIQGLENLGLGRTLQEHCLEGLARRAPPQGGGRSLTRIPLGQGLWEMRCGFAGAWGGGQVAKKIEEQKRVGDLNM